MAILTHSADKTSRILEQLEQRIEISDKGNDQRIAKYKPVRSKNLDNLVHSNNNYRKKK